jgi:hypothetical protein
MPGASAWAQYTGQPDSPQWLKDRRYAEGIGIRAGDLELHPGIAGEVGYDSNWLLRSNRAQCIYPKQDGTQVPVRCSNGPPIVPALEFRVTPSLYVSTLGPQRREGDANPALQSVAFRAGISATWREFVGLSSDSTGSNDVAQQNSAFPGGAADARLDILPEHPVGGALFATVTRAVQPNQTTGDPNFNFNRDDVGVGAELAVQPGSGTLDWRFGYQLRTSIFEESPGVGFNNVSHGAFTRGRWKFRPRTSLLYDAAMSFASYSNPDQALVQGLVGSSPVRTRIGLNGLITDRFAALLLVGWGASFYDTYPTFPQQKQYDSVIGQAELKWFLAASPGVAAVADVGLSLSSITLGYSRDFQNSYLGNFYGSDRGYLRFAYFFAGRALLTLEGGVGAVEYPDMYWLPTVALQGSNVALRHRAFTDVRADATLFGEYRFSNTFGLNATLRYTANFSSQHDMPDSPEATGFLHAFDMAWNRFEAFLGVRWFL